MLRVIDPLDTSSLNHSLHIGSKLWWCSCSIQLLVPQIMILKEQLKDSSKVSFRVQYPHNSENISREDCREFKQTRYACRILLRPLTAVEVMKLRVSALSVASLYCIRAISRCVSVVEAVVMPQ
ncbi:hypothetical protein MKW98_005948, partial [Papaver atlanticum]